MCDSAMKYCSRIIANRGRLLPSPLSAPLPPLPREKKKRRQWKLSTTRKIPAGRSAIGDVARDHAISELRTGRRDGQPTRGSN